MREAFHDQLDSIFDDLAEICRPASRRPSPQATEALLDGRRRSSPSR